MTKKLHSYINENAELKGKVIFTILNAKSTIISKKVLKINLQTAQMKLFKWILHHTRMRH